MLKRITARRLRGGRTAALALATVAALAGLGVAPPAAAVTTAAAPAEALYCTVTQATNFWSTDWRFLGTLAKGTTFSIINFGPKGWIYGDPQQGTWPNGYIGASHCDW